MLGKYIVLHSLKYSQVCVRKADYPKMSTICKSFIQDWMTTRVNRIIKKLFNLEKIPLTSILYNYIKRCVFCSVRLWGDHGQEALEGAKICLINASATGTEILKNLILPGSVILSHIFI